ncbi:hypothetical protein GCK32_021776 [Trichostrongylus colubriformis]|uniref:Uncharacterized protein n=1 Tax=Trichostrongylus colubriformis TaxID=6319 RepID=A0AAN8ISN8_TRICO
MIWREVAVLEKLNVIYSSLRFGTWYTQRGATTLANGNKVVRKHRSTGKYVIA